MALTSEDVRWVAHLARLHLSETELAEMAGQLSTILDYVAQLQQVNTEGVEPLAHPLQVSNVFRQDEVCDSLSVDEALQNAPQRDGNFFRVPAVLDQR